MIFSRVEKAIGEFRKGNFVIIFDDKHRENEADLVVSAGKITPQKVNFMITHAKGLVCVPMLGKRLDELKLPLMTSRNTEFTKCAFTISADAKKSTTTGISAYDRAATIKALVDESTIPNDLARPGHVFPLRCDENGLRKRQGHTEAAIELANLANLYPAAVICEIIGEDGKMAEMKEVERFAKKWDLKVISIKDLISYIGS